MENSILNLEPKRVFYYFNELSKIPRGSGNEKGVSDYLVSFAKELGLEVFQDKENNVLIKKPATKGYENKPGVILQGHLDMVAVKDIDSKHDFMKDGLDLYIDGDFVKARGTSLGADNGIAVAMGMALLEAQDLKHPAIELLATTDEENGMTGAANLGFDNIDGQMLINIDSEEEGIFLASCAGGVRSLVTLPIEMEKSLYRKSYRLVFEGVTGGHSGMEINKNRANAIKLLGRVLSELDREFDYDLARVDGGEKMNAIAKLAECIISTNAEYSSILDFVQILNDKFKREYAISEPTLNLALVEVPFEEKVLVKASKTAVIDYLRLMPNGVQSMSQSIEGLVESSLNIGILTQTGDAVLFESAIRSSVKSLKYEITDRIDRLARMVGTEQQLKSDYPEWAYKIDSELRTKFLSAYKKLFDKEGVVDAIHAGLECGLLTEKIGDMDMISFGPNMYDVHTPKERLSIQSTENSWKLLVEVLEQL